MYKKSITGLKKNPLAAYREQSTRTIKNRLASSDYLRSLFTEIQSGMTRSN